LRGVLDENGLDLEFYKEAIKRFDDDEAVPSLFTDSMVKISTRLGAMSMEDDYRPYVQVGNTRARMGKTCVLTLF
jgi:ubiquitin conjugation factor E4 B